jgi:hypothetical protein
MTGFLWFKIAATIRDLDTEILANLNPIKFQLALKHMIIKKAGE